MKKFLIFLFILIIGIQFIPVERTNPPITGDLEPPDNIAVILRASCYDCHSNETVWPWYSRIAPVSFLVADDVKEGREHLNFSEWNRYSSKEQNDLLAEMIEEIEKEAMPLTSYTFTHPNAKLDPYRINLLKEWVNQSGGSKNGLRYK